MSSITVGIDLGTTNSVVAVPGQYPDHGIVFGNTTVLWDDFERLTHASAVCKVDGELSVGDDAKMLASEGYTPVRFVKRYMGTDRTFPIGDQEASPQQVSAHILRHLANIVEQRLGVKVAGAVITHPAYFDGLAISATQESGSLSKLNVAGLLMEPVAAAMAYCSDDENPHQRILVYDLGGGTFDVTLVDRNGSSFQPIGFGGNRELGGYNFDKKIALEMLGQLRGKGYDITIDPKQPDRDPRWATLMHYGEEIKIKLAGKGSPKATVRVPAAFKDDAKKSVQLNFSMSYQEFVDLIKPEIESTIRETRKVLEGANLTKDDVDFLVLVGGSSRIAAIQERLKEEFSLDPQFDDDVLDLSVAVGAAMVAAASGTTENGVSLNAIPEETDESSVVFSGAIEATSSIKDVANLTVTVTGGVNGEQNVLTSAEGKFFLDVELEEECENELKFTVADASGNTLSDRSFVVFQSASEAKVAAKPPKAMLPKPIAVETASGFSELAEEGVALPFKGAKSFQTVKELHEIPIDLYQEDMQLTTILLAGFSQPVPANCRVEMEVEIGDDYTMRAVARVPSASIEKAQEVKLQPLAVPSLEELRSQYIQVKQGFESQRENTPDGEQKAKICMEADLVTEELDELIKAEFPEDLQIYMLIKKLYVLTKQLSLTGGLTPSKTEFDRKLSEARDKLRAAIAKKEQLREGNIDQIIDALESESQRAYQNADQALWSQLYRRMEDIIRDLEAAMQDGGGQLPDAPVLKMMLIQIIAQTRGEVSTKVREGVLTSDNANRCNEQLDTAEQKTMAVNTDQGQAAQQQLIGIYQQHIQVAQDIAGVVSSTGGVITEIG